MGYMYNAKPPFFVVRALLVDSLHYFIVGTSKYRTAFTFNEMMFSEPFLPSFIPSFVLYTVLYSTSLMIVMKIVKKDDSRTMSIVSALLC